MNGKWPCVLFGGDECELTLDACSACGCPGVTVLHAFLQCSFLAPHRNKLLQGLGYGTVGVRNTQQILISLFGQSPEAARQWSSICFVGHAIVQCIGAGGALSDLSLVGGIDVDVAHLRRLENNIKDILALQTF